VIPPSADRPDRLASARWEADRHAAVLGQALASWHALPVVPGLQAIESDPALRQLTDQILFRFMKLQDTLGERLIPATLGMLAETFEDWPMRDRLDRLEKLGYVDVESWLRWRELRNRLAHEYPDAPDLRYAQMLAAIAGADAMRAVYAAWSAKLPSQS
jgi:hypothetical protein